MPLFGIMGKPPNTHESSLTPLLRKTTLFEQTFKNIDDILHKDAGCGSELDYV